MYYDRFFDKEFDDALDALTCETLACEEEFDDRFDDYAEDGEPKNHDPDDFDDWEPMSTDEFMRMVL